MKQKIYSFLSLLVLTLITFFTNTTYAQCTIEGLDPVYCEGDLPVEISGDPLGGFFTGPGIDGSTFDPSAAGVGTHTITYEIPEGGTGDKYYIKSNTSVGPWGNTQNNEAMDLAFGVGEWTLENFQTLDFASVFSPTTGFIFMDGSDSHASELQTFLIANLPAIETWVFNGGRLLLNSAPNEGGNIDFGFDGSEMVYVGGGLSDTVFVIDLSHPAYLGPNLPTSPWMQGNWYTHSKITGTGFTDILEDHDDPAILGLREKAWGAGQVMMGGMTTHGYHNPDPHAGNWRSNLFFYLYNMGGDAECEVTQEVEVVPSPDVTITVSDDEICDGESVIFTASGADDYTWNLDDIVEGTPYFPSAGTTQVILSGFSEDLGCGSRDTVDVIVNVLPVANASTEEESYCEGDDVVFTNLSTLADVSGMTYHWDFGDGDESTDITPSHAYDGHGTFTVTLTVTSGNGCVDTYTFDVNVYDLPEPEIEFIVAGVSSEEGGLGGCVENEVQFNSMTFIADPETIRSYSWYFDDGDISTEENPTHTYDEAGTYTVFLTTISENGCISTTSIDIVMIDGLYLDFVINPPSCYGFSDGSIIVNVEDETGDILFDITDADGVTKNIDNSNAANSLTGGWYYINVSDGTACSGEDSIFLAQPEQIDADITYQSPKCYGDALGWVKVNEVFNATGDLDNISYIWAPDPSGVGNSDSTYALGAGEYVLTINDDNGCSNDFPFVITEPDSLTFVEFGYTPAYCRLYNYQNGNGTVYGSASGGIADYTYLWTHIETGETDNRSTWGSRNPGTYTLTATDNNGCTLSRTIVVDSLNPRANFEMTSDQFTTNYKGTADIDVHFVNNSLNFANPINPFADTTFFWNFDSPQGGWILSEDYDETFDTSYMARGGSYDIEVCLVALNKNGCTDTLCKTINVFEPLQLDAVNVFTPNNDGANDIFTFKYKSNSISEFYCVIIDRWGIKISEILDIDEGWDGTDRNGSESKDGVYFYRYEAKTDNGTEIVGQGNVTLLRN